MPDQSIDAVMACGLHAKACRTWRRSSARTASAAKHDAAIAYWTAQMPHGSTTRVAGYAGTSEMAVRRWRQANLIG